MPPTATDLDPRLTVLEAARLIGYSTQTLRRYREENTGPDYIRLPNGRTAYRLSAVRAWLEKREREHAESEGIPAQGAGA